MISFLYNLLTGPKSKNFCINSKNNVLLILLKSNLFSFTFHSSNLLPLMSNDSIAHTTNSTFLFCNVLHNVSM